MSYYYNYFLGKREVATGLVYPAAPFDDNGKMMCLYSRSRSFASDLWRDMDCLPEERMSEELKAQFRYKDWNDEETIESMRILPLAAMSGKEPFETAYVPVSDVVNKRQYEDDFEEIEFTDRLSPEQYAAFCLGYATDVSNTRKVERFDIETNEFVVVELKPTDYMYYRWVDTQTKTYESWMISTMVHNLDDLAWRPPDGFEWVILETEG